MPNVGMSATTTAAASELAQQLQTHHNIMTESIVAKRNELGRIEEEVDEVKKSMRTAKAQLGKLSSLALHIYGFLTVRQRDTG